MNITNEHKINVLHLQSLCLKAQSDLLIAETQIESYMNENKLAINDGVLVAIEDVLED